ncbi:hypothetical protein [Rhodospirillum centenum]|nr:hypothetical protein [Rhodospirillum centenum]
MSRTTDVTDELLVSLDEAVAIVAGRTGPGRVHVAGPAAQPAPPAVPETMPAGSPRSADRIRSRLRGAPRRTALPEG